MRVEKDFEDFIKFLNKNKVKFIIVGSYALAFHAIPRNTGDIDLFIEKSDKNSINIINAIKEFGFEGLGLKAEDFNSDDAIIQLGYPPNRIDILTSISGIEFSEAYRNSVKSLFMKEEVRFISIKDFIINKKASGRKKDISDIEVIQKVKKLKQK